MTMIFSLGSFAAHLVTVEADVKLACDAAVVKASKLVAKTAKNLLGHQQPFWPGLQPETIAHKAHGDTPLLETGELRDSISYTAPLHERWRYGRVRRKQQSQSHMARAGHESHSATSVFDDSVNGQRV